MVFMPKPRPDEIEEQLQAQDDAVYGTAYVDGDPDKYSDTDQMLEDVIGNEPDEEEDGFSLAEEVDKDEKAILVGSPNDDDESESEMDKIERKEKFKEDASDE